MSTPSESSDLLAQLSPEDREHLFSYGTKRAFKKREVIIRQGEKHDSLIFILKGTLKATCRSSSTAVALGDIPAGESIGEMNVLDPSHASATVQAAEEGECLAISRDDLDRFIADHPNAGNQVLRYLGTEMARRLRRSGDELIRNSEGRFGYDNDY